MPKSLEVIKFNKNGDEIDRYYNAIEASEKDNISIHVIRRAIHKHREINGYFYVYSGRYSDDVDNSQFKFKCPYCEEKFETYNGLTKHVFRFSNHKCESKEQLLTDFLYNGVRPTCKCGCGGFTNINYYNGAHFNDYIRGHASRIHNNWGNNPKAVENSSKTRREQYQSGERKQWNKGKSWKDTYSEEQIQKLIKKYANKERNDKIRNKLKGVKKSEEHAENIRKACNKEEYKKNLSDKFYERLKNNKFSISSRLEDEFIKEFIEPLNIEYKRQYYIKEIKQYCDIFIPGLNLIIECDGSFWHCDRRLFPNGAKYQYQKEKIEKDKIKNDYLLSHGYKLLRFWEIDIKNNKEMITEELKRVIK